MRLKTDEWITLCENVIVVQDTLEAIGKFEAESMLEQRYFTHMSESMACARNAAKKLKMKLEERNAFNPMSFDKSDR